MPSDPELGRRDGPCYGVQNERKPRYVRGC